MWRCRWGGEGGEVVGEGGREGEGEGVWIDWIGEWGEGRGYLFPDVRLVEGVGGDVCEGHFLMGIGWGGKVGVLDVCIGEWWSL